MLKKEEKQASEECSRPQRTAAARANSPSKTEGEFARIGTMCRGRKQCADASLGIGNDNTFARKGFFSEIHIVENKHAKLKFFIRAIRGDYLTYFHLETFAWVIG